MSYPLSLTFGWPYLRLVRTFTSYDSMYLSRVCGAMIIILYGTPGGFINQSIALESSTISASYVCRRPPRIVGSRAMDFSVAFHVPRIPRFPLFISALGSPRAACACPASSGVMSRSDRHHKAQAILFALDLFNEYLAYYSLRPSYLGEKTAVIAEYNSNVTLLA